MISPRHFVHASKNERNLEVGDADAALASQAQQRFALLGLRPLLLLHLRPVVPFVAICFICGQGSVSAAAGDLFRLVSYECTRFLLNSCGGICLERMVMSAIVVFLQPCLLQGRDPCADGRAATRVTPMLRSFFASMCIAGSGVLLDHRRIFL